MERETDGLELVVCYAPRAASPTRSNLFLVNASASGRPRIGYLYGTDEGLDGGEFDDRTYRYRVEALGGGRLRIRTIRRKGGSRKGAPGV